VRTLIDAEGLVADEVQLQAGYCFINAKTQEAVKQGSEQRKGVVKSDFIHVHDGEPYVHVAPTGLDRRIARAGSGVAVKGGAAAGGTLPVAVGAAAAGGAVIAAKPSVAPDTMASMLERAEIVSNYIGMTGCDEAKATSVLEVGS
jgi:hypothetical protein